jgi:magnesium transporter
MLVNCVAYQDGKKLADISKDEISEYVGRPDCFVWVALYEATNEEIEEMRLEFGLHPLAVEDASHSHQRPKIEEYGNSLFVVLKTVEVKGGEINVGEVHVFVGSNYVLSVRVRTEQGFQAVRTRCEDEPHLLRYGAAFVLYALMDTVVDRYFPVLDAIECELEDIEERIFTHGTARSNIEALYTLKKKLMTLHHVVEPLMEATGKLFGGRVPQLCAGMQEYFRDVYDHLQRIHATIEGVREMQATAIHVNLGMINLSETEVTKKLASWAAIIAVPTMIAGIYGMNFKHMPELEWEFGYPVVVVAMIAFDVMLYAWFRKTRWL